MARVAIPVASVESYQVGTAIPSTVTGDSTNDHSLSLDQSPKVILVAYKSTANSVTFTVELPAAKQTYEGAKSISHTVASGEKLYVIVIDLSTDLAQAGNLLHIDSADANFADLVFFAYTWEDTPNRC